MGSTARQLDSRRMVFNKLDRRDVSEEYDSTCTVDRIRKNNSYLSWGSFAGTLACPFVFWEKAWGKMTARGYCLRILPQLINFIRSNPGNSAPILMHDNAPVHTAATTKDYLRLQGVQPIAWPPYSPDLNPIESVWSAIKDHVYTTYGDSDRGRRRHANEVRPLVQEAWNECTQPECLLDIIKEMRGRCEAVITAQGGHTRY
ncbi:hypothetical protein K3495_g11977 [Podosphaera aphanis]|nr:hypothetical protein K3495_g11977 [Podosphaera aphanis]